MRMKGMFTAKIDLQPNGFVLLKTIFKGKFHTNDWSSSLPFFDIWDIPSSTPLKDKKKVSAV